MKANELVHILHIRYTRFKLAIKRYDDSNLDGLYIMDKNGNNHSRIYYSDCNLVFPDWN